MTENEVNEVVKGWLLSQGYAYKGILNTGNSKTKSNDIGYGQVPIPFPSGERSILIDHQGHNDRTKDLLWVEAKGGKTGMSQLLEGFIRVCAACYWGGGSGLLAIPTTECEQMLEQWDFLKRVAMSCERRVGILDAEKRIVNWL